MQKEKRYFSREYSLAVILMEGNIRLINRLQKGRQDIFNKKRNCLAKGCSEAAIKSHVLQRKRILNNITDDTNHFYGIWYPNIHDFDTHGSFNIKKIGLNEGYSFYGFCSNHDNDIFLPIETHPIDFTNKHILRLFTYRTICLEYRKKQIYYEQGKDVLAALKEIEPNKLHYLNNGPAYLALNDLEFYKSQLEEELESTTSSNFDYEVITLNEKKICFSSPLTIYDPSNEHTWEYDKYGVERTEPLATSIWNFFPYGGKSYLIVATHKKYKCRWAEDMKTAFKEAKNVDKLISDFLTYRLEFWGISPSIYETLSQQAIADFLLESRMNWDNYDYTIKTNFNLFAS